MVSQDRRIIENYNYMLLTYTQAEYDGYEAFRRLQEERGMVAVVETAAQHKHQVQVEASVQIQKTWRGYRLRELILVRAVGVPVAS
jgi:hypothetical protein